MRSYFPTFSARIRLNGEMIQYTLENKKIEFYAGDILMVGEFSAPPGALAADYFFTFKVRGQEKLLDIPAYADGIFELLATLKEFYPSMQTPRLQMSTEFNSYIMYPKELAGKSLYTFRQESKPWINAPVIKNIVVVEKVIREPNSELAGL